MSFIAIVYIFFGAVGQYLVSDSMIVSLCVTMISLILAIFWRKKSPAWKWFLLCVPINAIGLIWDGWYFFTIPALWNTLFGICLSVAARREFLGDEETVVDAESGEHRRMTRKERKADRKKRTLLQFFASVGRGFVIGFSALMVLNTFAPAVPLTFLRNHLYHTKNVFEAAQREELLPGGVRRITDIQYDQEYPNGFLDITYAPNPVKPDPMTVIYIHGGGFIWGDKMNGDPNARDRKYEYGTIANLVAAGYNVVSMNYVLTPEYTHPTPIKQLNHGLRYLKDHAGEWDLNMDSVAFAGVSAGGNLEGVLANIQTNPLCAAVVGEEPVFTNGELKGLIFESALIDYHLFGDAHGLFYNYLFYNMGRLYFRINDLKYDRRMNNANVTQYVTNRFPPSFISDGNTDTFYDQAYALYEGLNNLGVYAELCFYSVDEAGILWHGYEESGNEWSQKTMQRMILFLHKIDR